MTIEYGTAAAVTAEVAEIIRPPLRMQVSDAAQKNLRVKLPSGSYGPWDPTLTPYMMEPMNLLTAPEFEAMCFVGPARTGKTIGLDSWFTYNICCDPADMLILLTSQELARKYSKQRIDRYILNSPELDKRISRRANDDNTYDKMFRAGNVLTIGWPSIRQLSSLDYRYVAASDYDRRDKDDVDGEGDLFTQMLKRTQTYMSSGMAYVESSPGFEVQDAQYRLRSPHDAAPCEGIMSIYRQGDRRRMYWKCFDCGQYFGAWMEHLHFSQDLDDDRPAKVKAAEARMGCPHCGSVIEQRFRRELNLGHVWLRDYETISKDGERTGTTLPSGKYIEPVTSNIASFWMEGPAAAFQTWESIALKQLVGLEAYDKTGSESKLRAACTLDQGRPYLSRSRTSNRKTDELIARQVDYGKRVVPSGVRFLTASIDVQGGRNARFVIQVEGHGVGLQNWIIDRYNLRFSQRKTDPEDEDFLFIDPKGHPEDWDILIEKVIQRSYPLDDGSGRALKVKITGCDSGGEGSADSQESVTNSAYKFWRKLKSKRLQRNFRLLKGASSRNPDFLVQEKFPDSSKRKDRKSTARGDVPVYMMNTLELKDTVSNTLNRADIGPGYRHFPDWLGAWFFDELVAEVRTEKGWINESKKRNEAFDLAAYNQALLVLLKAERIDWDNPPAWAREWDDNVDVIEHVADRPDITPTKKSTPGRRRNRTRARFR